MTPICHLCSYKLCNPVLDYYQMIFNFPYFVWVNIQTDLHGYIYITQHVSIFKDCMVYWHMDRREGQVQFLLLPRDTCLYWISTFYVQNSLLFAYEITPNNLIIVEFCLEIFYIHISCFSLLILLGEHQRSTCNLSL